MSQAPLNAEQVNGRPRSPRVVIIGAGFGGIAAAIELRRHGFEALTILEAAPAIGGTWFYNTYPGAACDVPSHLYSYSYEQRRGWSRFCSPQQEILSYLEEVAGEYGIDGLVRSARRVTDCVFHPERSVWEVQDRGRRALSGRGTRPGYRAAQSSPRPDPSRSRALHRTQLSLGPLGSRV